MVLDNSKALFPAMPQAPTSPNVSNNMTDIIQSVKETVWTKPVVMGSLAVLAITGICLAVYWNKKADDDNAGSSKWPWTNNHDGSNES